MRIQASMGRLFQHDKKATLAKTAGKLTLTATDDDPCDLGQKKFEGELLARLMRQLREDQISLMRFLRKKQQ